MTNELAYLDAIAQAELVRRGAVTPLELVDAAIARIEKLNPKLNAVITPLFDKARAQAASPNLPEGPVRGVPFGKTAAFSLKDPTGGKNCLIMLAVSPTLRKWCIVASGQPTNFEKYVLEERVL